MIKTIRQWLAKRRRQQHGLSYLAGWEWADRELTRGMTVDAVEAMMWFDGSSFDRGAIARLRGGARP